MPANLQPAAGERELERLSARGNQTYECRAKPGDPAGPAWVYIGSQLDLFDAQGRNAGRHTFPPPVWTAPDGSAFATTPKARADAPVPGAAPWLLADARSIGRDGRFSRVTSMQRVNTVGGVPPAQGCEQKSMGARALVPFTTDFVLFAR